jgi:hypothetical protein
MRLALHIEWNFHLCLESTNMSSTVMIYSSIGVWFAMVATLVGVSAIAGMHVTVGTGAVALAVGLMPPAMMLRWRAAGASR